uniref:Uncharacterized protein n=1 Tax=Arundo donax TaxID=35708 RepID=A0A0A9AGA0_ARUDO
MHLKLTARVWYPWSTKLSAFYLLSPLNCGVCLPVYLPQKCSL